MSNSLHQRWRITVRCQSSPPWLGPTSCDICRHEERRTLSLLRRHLLSFCTVFEMTENNHVLSALKLVTY